MPASSSADQAFFAALLAADEDSNDERDVGGHCPIKKVPLGEDAVRLPCGHTFSYAALAEELQGQRRRQKAGQDRSCTYPSWACPYCRCSVSSLLPFNPICLPSPVHGVNSPARLRMVPYTCQHVSKKGTVCGKEAFRLGEGGPILCATHHLYSMRTDLQKSKEDLLALAAQQGLDVDTPLFPKTKRGIALQILAKRNSSGKYGGC